MATIKIKMTTLVHINQELSIRKNQSDSEVYWNNFFRAGELINQFSSIKSKVKFTHMRNVYYCIL